MLSISQVGSSGGAAAYYTAEDNYYFIGESRTEWFGKGSDQLGLSGAVDKDQFKSVLDGYLPDGSDLSF
ncbi:relaxase domain-containing protein, partial [Glaesserella parasuis]|uniref:relaxase domain-containing protein n=1 Tax=Glaesserella parasuis TaxID=738 RepID=UPI003B67A37A